MVRQNRVRFLLATPWAALAVLALVSLPRTAARAQQARPITSLPKAPDDPTLNPATAPTPRPPAAAPAPPPAPAPQTATQPAPQTTTQPAPQPKPTPPSAAESTSQAPAAPTVDAAVLRASTPNKPGVEPKPANKVHFFSTAAIGVTGGIGGFGAQLAVPLTQTLNFRVGGAFFSYSGAFDTDGIQITGDLKLRSATANIDWFPFHGGFRISPGVTVYNGNNLNAAALVPGGQTFDLGDATYTSSASDPVHGTASFTFGKRTAPNVTIGWGNMIPRSNKHFTVPVEIGFQYIGPPKISLSLAGSACANGGCAPIATDPSAQSNLRQEEKDLNDTISPLRFYPIASIGLAYKF